jgi:hypothetical protein
MKEIMTSQYTIIAGGFGGTCGAGSSSGNCSGSGGRGGSNNSGGNAGNKPAFVGDGKPRITDSKGRPGSGVMAYGVFSSSSPTYGISGGCTGGSRSRKSSQSFGTQR